MGFWSLETAAILTELAIVFFLLLFRNCFSLLFYHKDILLEAIGSIKHIKSISKKILQMKRYLQI